MMRALLLIFAVLTLPGIAHAVCNLQTGTWGPTIEDFTGSTSGTCSGSAGGPAPTESWTIQQGSTVTCAPDSQIDQTDAAIGGTVNGILDCSVSDDETRITVGQQGYTESSTGITRATGGCLEVGDSDGDGTPYETIVPCPYNAEASEAHLWSVGEIVPCDGWDDDQGWWVPDCNGDLVSPNDVAGDPQHFGFHYPDSLYSDGAEGSPEYDLMIDEVVAGDPVRFRDPYQYDLAVPAEVDLSYEVEIAEGSGGTGKDANNARLVIDLMQGATDSGAYGFAQRRTVQALLQEDVPRGSRVIYLPDTVISADGERKGQWLRFRWTWGGPCPGESGYPGTEPCIPQERAYRIQSTANDVNTGATSACQGANTCDEFVLANTSGLPVGDHVAGETAWISTEGIRPGDPFYVQKPVRFVASGGGHAAGQDFELEGSAELETVVLQDFEGAGGAADFLGSGATPQKLVGIWFLNWWSDTTGGDNNMKAHIDGAQSTTPLLGFSFTGAASVAEAQSKSDHCMGFVDDGSETPWVIRDFAARHCGDDFIIFNPGNQPTRHTLQNVRCEYSSGPADASQECIGFAGSNRGVVTNAFCWDCNRDNAAFAGNDATFNGVVMGAADGGFANGSFYDSLIVANALDNADKSAWAEPSADGTLEFVRSRIRDSEYTNASAGTHFLRLTSDGAAVSIRESWLSDNRQSGSDAFMRVATNTTDLALRFELLDSVVLNNHRIDTTQFAALIDLQFFSDLTLDTVTIRRNVLGYTPDQDEAGELAGVQPGADALIDTDARFEVDDHRLGGNLYTGAQHVRGLFVAGTSTVGDLYDAGASACFFRNAADSNALTDMAAAGIELFRQRRPSMPGLDAGEPQVRLGTPFRDAGCGPKVQSVGLCDKTWALSANGLEPECLGPVGGGGGGGSTLPRGLP